MGLAAEQGKAVRAPSGAPPAAFRASQARRSGRGCLPIGGGIADTWVMGIIGREHELALANLFLDDAAQRFSVLDVHGEAGIGKTTVWKAVLDRAAARGFQILECRPSVAEAKLSFAGISDLLERVPEDAFAHLSRPQRLALDVALLRAEPGDAAVDRRTVGVAIRSLLRELAGGGRSL